MAKPVPLPMSRKELKERGIDELDFVLVSGDAYVDHPSFGPAIIGRVLEAKGFRVGMIAQPQWQTAEDFKKLGRPRLAFLVTSGNLDSMVNHYSVNKRRRKTDAYAPGGKMGLRPDRATIVYANKCKEAYKGVPVILGGIEASLRRFAHYDYWDERVRHSILIDSGADLLVYGMGERAIVEVAEALRADIPISSIRYVAGTGYYTYTLDEVNDHTLIASYQEVGNDKVAYAKAFMQQYREQDAISGKKLVQPHEKGYVVINPPAMPLEMNSLDGVYDLPYTRKAHPSYQEKIPALDEVAFSLTSCRGCYGACSFCALTFHQGRVVQARSHRSLIEEAKKLTADDAFKGYIHDVGGPTANFRAPACDRQKKHGACKDRQCIGYERCTSLKVDHSDYLALLRKLRSLPGVKKVFVRSGLRYDYIMYDKDKTFFKELVAYHISGRLKVAPEHVDERVLSYMNKPSSELYDRFVQRYGALNKAMGRDQHIEPYFISSHPGCDLNAAIALAQYLKDSGQRPEQVQDFYPTPGTLSTCMFYTGLDPRDMKPVYIPKTQKEKNYQRALMQYFMPVNHRLVREALKNAGRDDLIGHHRGALVPPERQREEYANAQKGTGKRTATGRNAKSNYKRKKKI
ncbi:YgiQ family radical SAM protein [Christensenellaceae bacterium OttesenSCG-928-M15]|nr:YgiQ family radical SAM protein [Christensenellaceae bacterium OttesenSCG-928-M15]